MLNVFLVALLDELIGLFECMHVTYICQYTQFKPPVILRTIMFLVGHHYKMKYILVANTTLTSVTPTQHKLKEMNKQKSKYKYKIWSECMLFVASLHHVPIHRFRRMKGPTFWHSVHAIFWACHTYVGYTYMPFTAKLCSING